MTPPITFGEDGGDRGRQKNSRKLKRFRDASMLQKRESKQDRFGRQRGGRKARWDKLGHSGALKNRARFAAPDRVDSETNFYELQGVASPDPSSPGPPSPTSSGPTTPVAPELPDSVVTPEVSLGADPTAKPVPRKVQLNANATPFLPSSSLDGSGHPVRLGNDGGRRIPGTHGSSKVGQPGGSDRGPGGLGREGLRSRRRSASARLSGTLPSGDRMKVTRGISYGGSGGARSGAFATGGGAGATGADWENGGRVRRAPRPPSLFESVFKDKLPSLTPRKTPQPVRVSRDSIIHAIFQALFGKRRVRSGPRERYGGDWDEVEEDVDGEGDEVDESWIKNGLNLSLFSSQAVDFACRSTAGADLLNEYVDSNAVFRMVSDLRFEDSRVPSPRLMVLKAIYENCPHLRVPTLRALAHASYNHLQRLRELEDWAPRAGIDTARAVLAASGHPGVPEGALSTGSGAGGGGNIQAAGRDQAQTLLELLIYSLDTLPAFFLGAQPPPAVQGEQSLEEGLVAGAAVREEGVWGPGENLDHHLGEHPVVDGGVTGMPVQGPFGAVGSGGEGMGVVGHSQETPWLPYMYPGEEGREGGGPGAGEVGAGAAAIFSEESTCPLPGYGVSEKQGVRGQVTSVLGNALQEADEEVEQPAWAEVEAEAVVGEAVGGGAGGGNKTDAWTTPVKVDIAALTSTGDNSSPSTGSNAPLIGGTAHDEGDSSDTDTQSLESPGLPSSPAWAVEGSRYLARGTLEQEEEEEEEEGNSSLDHSLRVGTWALDAGGGRSREIQGSRVSTAGDPWSPLGQTRASSRTSTTARTLTFLASPESRPRQPNIEGAEGKGGADAVKVVRLSPPSPPPLSPTPPPPPPPPQPPLVQSPAAAGVGVGDIVTGHEGEDGSFQVDAPGGPADDTAAAPPPLTVYPDPNPATPGVRSFEPDATAAGGTDMPAMHGYVAGTWPPGPVGEVVKLATRSLCTLYTCHGAASGGGGAGNRPDLGMLGAAGHTLCALWPPVAVELARRLLGGWPTGSAYREVAYLRLLSGVLCAVLPVGIGFCQGAESMPRRLVQRLAASVRSTNVKVALEACTLVQVDFVLNYLVPDRALMDLVTTALCDNRRHWSTEVCQASERAFDCLLDYL